MPALIHLWWAAWLISTFAERIFWRQSMDAGQSPADFVSMSQTYIAWDLVDVIPAALAFLVVMKITARQEERRGRFERGELDLGDPAPPAPEAYEPFPTDVPAPQTLSDRLGRPA